MIVRISYTVHRDAYVDMTPEEYLRLKRDDEKIRKKVKAPRFRTNIESFEPRDVDEGRELMEYIQQKRKTGDY